MKIAYIEGKKNIIADYLSRHIKDHEEWSAIPFNSLELTELLYNTNDLIALQREDGELSKLFAYMEGGNDNKDIIDVKYRRFLDRFQIEEGLLKFNHRGDLCTVIPEKLRSEVLEFCHNDWSAGHYGSFKTHKRILQRLFWWPKLFDDVENFIKDCKTCQTIKKG